MTTTQYPDSTYPLLRKHNTTSGYAGDLNAWHGGTVQVRTGNSRRVHAIYPGALGLRTLGPACGATLGTRTYRTPTSAPVNCPNCLAYLSRVED